MRHRFLVVLLWAGVLFPARAADPALTFTPLSFLLSQVKLSESPGQVAAWFDYSPARFRNNRVQALEFDTPPRNVRVTHPAPDAIAVDPCNAQAAWRFQFIEGKLASVILSAPETVPLRAVRNRAKPLILSLGTGSYSIAVWELDENRVLLGLGLSGKQQTVGEFILLRREILPVLYPEVHGLLRSN
jgi:hypothetical protein